MESAGDVLVEVIVVEDGTSPAIPRPDFTGGVAQHYFSFFVVPILLVKCKQDSPIYSKEALFENSNLCTDLYIYIYKI